MIRNIGVTVEHIGSVSASFILFNIPGILEFRTVVGEYYREILKALALTPEECVMVGNDTRDDMSAAALGMRVFLLTDCLINEAGEDISKYPHGDFSALAEYLRSLN